MRFNMRILVLNAGSASLKFDVIAGTDKLFSGAIEGIGKQEPTFSRMAGKSIAQQEPVQAGDYAQATTRAFELVKDRPDLVAHRVVHGGERFDGPVLVDEKVIAQIEELEDIAPLHNASALQSIRAARQIVGNATPMVASFDTVFHRSIPKCARTYAIPPELAERHAIHRGSKAKHSGGPGVGRSDSSNPIGGSRTGNSASGSTNPARFGSAPHSGDR